MKHVNLLVMGKVQGVFFRASTQRVAGELGITGLVRNEPDGNVYIEAEGEEGRLEKFIDWCRQGPPRARVEQVQITESGLKNYATFRVVR
ncbi:MAG: acylphosphatase [Flammeovirgaceae bacterium]|nr:MAG: acylphosphatase [Flammeovirgaceae bacterium]